MTYFLLYSALIPVFYAALGTGDVTQFVYKPSPAHVYRVVRHRWLILAGSVALWLTGLVSHFLAAPAAPAHLFASGGLLFMLALTGLFMPAYIMFPAVRRPDYEKGSELKTPLDPDEPVIGLVINGDARAYPIKAIRRPHVVEDIIGGIKVIVTYCLLSNSAVVFPAEYKGQRLRFITPLQYENNLVLYDAASRRLVQQINGLIRFGADAGQRLPMLPVQIMSWSAWQAQQPQTKVFVYERNDLAAPFVNFMLAKIAHDNWAKEAPIFNTIPSFDTRLNNKTEVLGLNGGASSKAYAADLLQRRPVINDYLDGQPVLIVHDPDHGDSNAFHRDFQGQELTFQRSGGRLEDKETLSIWNEQGQAVLGPLQGHQLEPLPHLNQVLWFVWANFHRDTEVAS